jgi:hypothetical protein
MTNTIKKMSFIAGVFLSCQSPQKETNFFAKQSIPDTTIKPAVSVDSFGISPFFTQNAALKLLTMSKSIDSTSSAIAEFDSAVFNRWNLSETDIFKILNNSRQISGAEWDVNYVVLPYCFAGNALIDGRKCKYRINAGGASVLGFADTTIFFRGSI